MSESSCFNHKGKGGFINVAKPLRVNFSNHKDNGGFSNATQGLSFIHYRQPMITTSYCKCCGNASKTKLEMKLCTITTTEKAWAVIGEVT